MLGTRPQSSRRRRVSSINIQEFEARLSQSAGVLPAVSAQRVIESKSPPKVVEQRYREFLKSKGVEVFAVIVCMSILFVVGIGLFKSNFLSAHCDFLEVGWKAKKQSFCLAVQYIDFL